jgi:serine/threonine protein kinase
MPEITAHPSREQLRAYNLGKLPPDEAVAVESHIGECEPCCDTIISLSSDDTFVGLLKEAGQLPTERTVDHRVATVCSLCQDVPVQLAEHPRYEILGLIGKGGMGDVYKARHRKMERMVALKVINRGLVQKPEAVDRFHREVKAAAQLSHPNIVTAYDADQASDFHFMVMEYVDGVDLSQKVKQRGALPVAEACDYIRQAATGLQHAHERGMVHRDIKPHNLMASWDGTVKILDFGLASLAPETSSDPETVEATDSRPTVFDSQPGSVNDVVLTLKRTKPAESVGNDNAEATHDGQLTEELARELIPRAASMSKEEFQKLQTNPSAQALESKSLSLILMTLDVRGQTPEAASDFKYLVDGYPKPSEIAAAMSPSRSKGYFSMIQPDYITECKITSSTDEIAQGKVTFNAPKLYIGSVVFEAKKHKKEWRIEKFQLSSRQISIVLGEDGNWHRQSEGKD